MNLEEIKQKMFNKLEPSGWGRIFKSFIFSSEFDDIIIKLWNLSQADKRFTPPLKQIFRAFEECPYDKLKVVFLNIEPYYIIEIADGIAFSCSNTPKIQSHLKFILDAVNKTVYNNEEISCDTDLKRWSNQGILMFNISLTAEVNKINAHYNIWKPFTAYLLDWLNNYNPGIIYVYMGKKVEEWSILTNDNNHKFFIKHPGQATYYNNKWDCDNIFNEINRVLLEKHNEKIIW
jgi:uracil-DNA glycosylase